MKKHLKQQGFTLLEMMITVAVIGILAVIAFPSYMHYIERGHLTQAYNELVNMNNHIKTERIKNPSSYKSQTELTNLIGKYHKDVEVEKRYDFLVYVPNQNSIAYNLIATPKSSSGYTKAVWMSSAGDAYRCSNAAAAREYAVSGDCEKIGG